LKALSQNALHGAFAVAGRRYPRLLAVSAIASAAVYGVVFLGTWLSRGIEGPARYAALGGGMAVGLVIQSLFVYATPLIILEGFPAPAAIASGISLSLRTFTRTLLIVGLPFLLTTPTILLDIKAGMIAMRLSPEFMIQNYIASRVMEMVSIYLITASATVVFIAGKTAGPRGAGQEGEASR
jgi:hypothetical protein